MPCKRKPGSEGASDGKTRRKIDGEGRALRSGPHQVERAAMAAHDLGRDREPETRAALARAAMERLEQVIERLFRQAGPGVGNLDPPAGCRFLPLALDLA